MYRMSLLLLCAVLTTSSRAAPDLAIRREGFARQSGDILLLLVENLGADPSPATVVEIRDRPFLGGPTGTSSHYRPLRGVHAVWVDQEPDGADAIRLTVHLGREYESLTSRGEIVFSGTERVTAEARAGVQVDGAGQRVTWTIEVPPEGVSFHLWVPARPGQPPGARLALRPDGDAPPAPVYTHVGSEEGSATLVLDCLDRPAAVRERRHVPPLEPGERLTVQAVCPGGALGEVAAWVDPDDEVAEIREGNNASTWNETDDRWTLAAPHVHSCFSEGTGSFDWQVWHAALSGYDLVWWSEHDWRVSCHTYLEAVDFEPGGGVSFDFESTGDGARGQITSRVGSVRRGALSLATGTAGGECLAHLSELRHRFRYCLASGLEVSLRVMAQSLRMGDAFSVGFDLSRHPGEKRSLVYRFRWEGSEDGSAAPEGDTPWAIIVPRTLPTGGWVTVRLPVSRDAASSWPNGLDGNLMQIWFELLAQAETDVLVDDLTFAHETCGERLVGIQTQWTHDYPNIRHEIGGEISLDSPHMNRYGGDPSVVLYDLGRVWEAQSSVTDDADEVVRVVHRSSGLVSWCHPLPGIGEPMIERRFAGADIVEVGYRRRAGSTLEEHLALWDGASASGIVITAIGVNDSHGRSWAPWESNFGTWLEAPVDDTHALLRAMRDGHAFFGDPVLFRGHLELRSGDARTGDTVVGDAPHPLEVALTDIGESRTVRLIVDGELLREWSGVSGSGVLEELLQPGRARSVRAEIWSADGRALAFTNPIFFDPDGTLRRGDAP
jgi:hypothetical protein